MESQAICEPAEKSTKKPPENNFEVEMLTGGQIRAARALLRVSRKELAEAAELNFHTIEAAEKHEGIPGGMKAQTLMRIKWALEEKGAEFTNDDQPGVRLKGGIVPVAKPKRPRR